MPNWCMSNFYINPVDDSKKNIEKMKNFLEKFDKWTSSLNVSDYKTKWLGNPLIASGLCEKIGGNVFIKDTDVEIPCRGSIEYTDINSDGQIQIQTQTAWGWIAEPIRLLVTKEIPGAEIIFSAEEPGNGIFDTNDPCLINTYIIDIFDDSLINNDEFMKIVNDTYICDAGDETIRIIAKYLKIEDEYIDNIIAKLTREYDISINKWNYVNINNSDFTNLSDKMINDIINRFAAQKMF